MVLRQMFAAGHIYQSVEVCHPGILQPRQVPSKARHGSQNNNLRRYSGIASMP
jgi:hypothetical protein